MYALANCSSNEFFAERIKKELFASFEVSQLFFKDRKLYPESNVNSN